MNEGYHYLWYRYKMVLYGALDHCNDLPFCPPLLHDRTEEKG